MKILSNPLRVGLAAVTLGAVALATSPADADIQGNLITCTAASGDVGDAEIKKGLTTVESKNTISGEVTLPCTADEAMLDEIASESDFGLKKTSAEGRTAIASSEFKFKFSSYGDCLNIALPNDPDQTGEYPATYGTLGATWLDSAGDKVGKSTAFAVLDAGVVATVNALVTKGIGVGATVTLTAGFTPSPLDDENGNALLDFIECTVLADATAVGKYLDVIGPVSVTIDLPLL